MTCPGVMDELSDYVDYAQQWSELQLDELSVLSSPSSRARRQASPPTTNEWRSEREKRHSETCGDSLNTSHLNLARSAMPRIRAPAKGLRTDEAHAICQRYIHKQLSSFMRMSPTMNPIALRDLPLTRIKRIMKQDACDPQPCMVSATSVVAMAYTTQLFIGAITTLAWTLATRDKRNTLQLKDLRASLPSLRAFDFLVDLIDEFEYTHGSKSASGMKPPRAALLPDSLHPEQRPSALS